MVENVPCNAGHMDLIPGQGTKIPQAMEQLNACATTRESVPHSEDPVCCSQGPRQPDKEMHDFLRKERKVYARSFIEKILHTQF